MDQALYCCISVSVKPWGCSKIFTFTDFPSVPMCQVYNVHFLANFYTPPPPPHNMTWSRVSESLYGYRLLQTSLSPDVFHLSVNLTIKFLLAYQELFCMATLIGAREPTTMMTNRFNKQNKKPGCASHFLDFFFWCHCKTNLVNLDKRIALCNHFFIVVLNPKILSSRMIIIIGINSHTEAS